MNNKFFQKAHEISLYYIIIGAIVSYLITFDKTYPLGFLIGGVTNLLLFGQLKKRISTIPLGENLSKFFISNNIFRIVCYAVVIFIAAIFNYYHYITTALGFLSVRIGLTIAAKIVKEEGENLGY